MADRPDFVHNHRLALGGRELLDMLLQLAAELDDLRDTLHLPRPAADVAEQRLALRARLRMLRREARG